MESPLRIFFSMIVVYLGVIYLFLFMIPQDSDQDYYELYKDCKVLEVNHYNGFYSNNTNKLDCDGVIYNVDTNKYNEAFKIHQ